MKSDYSVAAYTTIPHIHIVGTSRCVIDGLRGILEYSGDSIKLNLGKYSVTIIGDGLHIDAFSHEGAIIDGTILSMELGSV